MPTRNLSAVANLSNEKKQSAIFNYRRRVRRYGDQPVMMCVCMWVSVSIWVCTPDRNDLKLDTVVVLTELYVGTQWWPWILCRSLLILYSKVQG